MHRTTLVPRSLLCGVLAALALYTCVPTARPQAPDQPAGVLILQVGATKKVGMSKGGLIAVVAVENPKVGRAQSLIEDPRAVLISGIAPGMTRVTLTDDKKQTESFEVRVLADEDTAREQQSKDLMELIRRAVPTASVGIIASPNNTVTLSGHVANPQTVQVILELARSVFGASANVVNNLQIGGVQQVQIEVTVANVNRSEARNLGFSFLETGKNHFLASTVAGAGSLAAANLTSVLSPAAALAATPNAVFGIINDKQGFVGFLSALRTEGLAKIFSEPYVATLSGRPGYIISGGETPILTTSGTGAPSVTYKQFGTVVNFLPIVMENGKIHLEVRPEISNLNAASGINIPSAVGVTSIPGFDVRSAQVAVQLEDGQTLAIGGLVQNRINATMNKVPILGDLPFLGTAFSQKQFTESEEELIILVTPRLVHPMGCNQLPKHLPGRETRSADDFELFLEGIMEAPRGPRTVCRPYTAAHMTGPTAGTYPCAGDSCGNGTGAGRCLGHCGIKGGCDGTVCGGRVVMPALTARQGNSPASAPVTNTMPAAKLNFTDKGTLNAAPIPMPIETPAQVRTAPEQPMPPLPVLPVLPTVREQNRDQDTIDLPTLPPLVPQGEGLSNGGTQRELRPVAPPTFGSPVGESR